MRFDKEDIAKASTSSLVLVVTVDMLIWCWIISHATGSRYVVRTFTGGLWFEVRVHA
jgi:hypothetical protein